jgi:hypothetical protein
MWLIGGLLGAIVGLLLVYLRDSGIDANIIAWQPHVLGDGQGNWQSGSRGEEEVVVPIYYICIGKLQAAEVLTEGGWKPVPFGLPFWRLRDISMPAAPFGRRAFEKAHVDHHVDPLWLRGCTTR